MPARLPSLESLRLLVGVDDLGSLSAAGRVVHLSQPNASRAIKMLEQQLSLPLIERGPTGSKLTAQGTVIAQLARQVLIDADKLVDVAAGLSSNRSAELTIAASMTVAEHLMPQWLAQFRLRNPDITIHLQACNSSQVMQQVRMDACDIGFVEAPTIVSGLRSTEVARDQLVVVVSTDHAWARRRTPLRAAELAATPLLVREPGSGTRTSLEVALQEFDLASPLLELGSAAAIRTSVLNNVGAAVLSTLAIDDQVRSGRLKVVRVDGLCVERSLRAVWRAPRRLDGPGADFVRHVTRRGGKFRTPESRR